MDTLDIAKVASENSVSIDTIWILIAAVLVFFMQAGFGMVEAGFTRAKNVGNIIMKNLMDLSIGSLVFWFVGFSIMFGPSVGGFIGGFNFFFTADYGNDVPDMAILIFQTMFAATAATIVSGAMAERTRFGVYLIFTLIITLVIYPISGHWVWGDGWLAEMGFHDFAGSTVVHSVGGWVALAGAAIVGPRLGKYTNGKVNAIPGHNMVLGALGVFILWLGWFGFNPGSELAASGDSVFAIAHIFVTTNLSAVASVVVTMFLTWKRYGKPDLSMTLNGALAGLVAITAGTDIVSPGGAVIIGALAGVVLVFGIELIDKVLKVDDPVGAITVHGLVGAFGTIMVGLFATEGGVFYGGGWSLFGVQVLGVVVIAAWALGTAFLLFTILKHTTGLRVSEKEEREGLDIHEHGQSSYNY
ncbi:MULTISPECIES: ammonium transporter [Marinilabiliaceae]|uniref:Ammonium transporter n=2 Tax=Marinilabiliaceae TaxID=558415 RepID=A0A1T5D8G8_9BACT|nr:MULTISPECIES: ammonium transporter [Marinilabiliaceae]ASB50616.1 ammonium transporter [Alkalitalea saponilacus]TCO09276.1 Amt family ammonium transporter [Natronoflexus pectinivorans]SKB67881.1 ammonium transporter, Amt family [Alkalitalea saponilacus]